MLYWIQNMTDVFPSGGIEVIVDVAILFLT